MDRLNSVFAALADPTRVRILLLVRDIELAMGELADLLGQSQPRVSRHVRILAEAGLVRRHKEGAFVFVGPGDSGTMARIEALVASVAPDRDPIAAERVRLAQVRADRQAAVDAWFAAHAGEWDLMRALGGPDAAIETAIVEAARLPAVGRLLDIGTGTGRILELLAADADSATGIDRSPEMLRLARGKLSAAQDRQAELRQADMRSLPFSNASFETVTLHHVLHFADDPAAILIEAGRVVAPGGKILVADYAPHDREELRQRFHHVRLGFEEAAVTTWLMDAGLTPTVRARHAGPGLTTTLWEGRR